MKTIKYSKITPESVYKNRRSFLKRLGFGASTLAFSSIPLINNGFAKDRNELTSYKDITTYNNYYEFGTSKSDPYKNSQTFKTTPWAVSYTHLTLPTNREV